MKMTLTLLVTLLSIGCGTVMHGPRDTLFIDSRPDGAHATIACNNAFTTSGTTPAKLVVPRKAEGCNLSVEKRGHRTQRMELGKTFSGAFWTNFAFSPVLATATIIGGRDFGYDTAAALLSSGVAFLVDQATGAKYKYEPREVVVELEPVR